MEQVAADAADKVVALLTSVKATRDRADPTSLMNRVAKLYVPEVTGAPGDGNVALTRAIRASLPELGPLPQATPDGTDFTIRGTVSVAPIADGQQRVEIVWTVTRPSGAVVGNVSQLNGVPAGSLSLAWGEVATVVAREAAGGIDRVVQRFAGRDPDSPPDSAPRPAEPPKPGLAAPAAPRPPG